MRIRWIFAFLGGGVLAACAAWLVVVFVGLAVTPVVSPLRGQAGEGETDDDLLGVSAVYQVTSEGALSPQPRDEATSQLWDVFVRTVGEEFASSEVLELRVGDSGHRDAYAYVESDDETGLWRLGANLRYSRNLELLVPTMFHEYGHILSFGVYEEKLWSFEEEFWWPYGDDAPLYDNTDPDVTAAFFAANEEDFVDQYAATNVYEDFAETFMTFVQEPEPEPGVASPTADKLAWFWAEPDFVDERERLRAEFALD